jgi:hypothetical protein
MNYGYGFEDRGLSFDIKACRVGARYEVSHLEMNTCMYDIESRVRSDMAHGIANQIVIEKMNRAAKAFSTEFSCEVYVLTYEQLCELVQRESLRLSARANLNNNIKDYK